MSRSVLSQHLNRHTEALDVAEDGEVQGLGPEVLGTEADQDAAVNLVAVAEELGVGGEGVGGQPAADVLHRPLEDLLRGERKKWWW